MPITSIPAIEIISQWGNIYGNILDQSDLQESLLNKADISHSHDSDYTPSIHQDDTQNPHQVSKSQIGLANISNDAQLKRSASDFSTFSEKHTLSNNDLLLIEDSEDSFQKKKIKIEKLKAGGSSGFTSHWKEVNASFEGQTKFSFSGSYIESREIIGALFYCYNADESVLRIGYIKACDESSGLITVTVLSTSILEADDIKFNISEKYKIWDFMSEINIPGELIADTQNSQGRWLQDIKFDSYLIAVDSSLRTPASGLAAGLAWNIYKNNVAIFSNAQNMGSDKQLNDCLPSTKSIEANSEISLRISSSAGDISKAADIQIKLYITPKSIFPE